MNRYDCRPVLGDNVSDLRARQVALKRHNPAIIDDRDVEALALALIAVGLQIPYVARPGLVTGPDASRPG